MKKFRIFTSLDQEEKWINDIQAQGYQLLSVNPWLATYRFEKCSSATIPTVRIDFQSKMNWEDYMDYISLFDDAGWRLLKGSRRNGQQYFQKTEQAKDDMIFSDEESKSAYYKRYRNFALTYFTVFLANSIIHSQVWMQSSYHLFKPKTWFLSPGLWQDKGWVFWSRFLFELPFALMRSGLIFIFLLALSLYFLYLAYKSRPNQ